MTVQLKYRFNIFFVCSFHLSPLLLDIVSPLSLRCRILSTLLFTVICNDFINATESWKLLLPFLSLSPSLIFHIASQLQLSHILHKVGYANQTKSPAPIIQFRSANYDLCKWIELELLVGRIEKPLHCTAVDVVFSINNLDVPCRFMAPPSAAKDDDLLYLINI